MKKNLLHSIFIIATLFIFFHAHNQILIPQPKANNQEIPEKILPETLILEGNLFVKLIASKTSCMVNEPVLVTYKFYTRLNAQAKVSELPTFTGCSVQEMATENTFPEIEEMNGRTFKSYIIRKVLLYPLQIGEIVLGAATVENTFSIYNKGTTVNDIRNGRAVTQNKTITVSNKPISIHVADFPLKNKPANFDGAVGNFTIKAMVNKRNDTANENNSLQIVIEGEGSFQNINCPVVAWPSNIENFEPVTTDRINKVTYPASGAKIFDLPFIAKTKGQLIIPAISFSFYDMQTHTYKTVQTESITIDVAAAKPVTIDQTKIHENTSNTKYIWIVGAIALIAGISLWLAYGFERKNKSVQMVQQAALMMATATQETHHIEPEKEETAAEKLNQLLLCENDHSFFGQAKNLCHELLLKETDAATKNALQQLVNDCNAVLYGAGNSSKDEVVRRLEELIG